MDPEGGDAGQIQHHIGRIPRNAAKGTVIFLYVLAIIAAGLRTVIRLRYHKLQWLDDGFTSLAILFMTVSFGIFFGFFNDLYTVETLIYDPYSAGDSLSSLILVAERVQLYTVVYIIISISGIFAVKFSFLFFFRNILSRIRPLVLYWRAIAMFTATAWALSIGFSVYGCPYVDERALSCAQGPKLYKAIDTSIVLIVFDICSDLLIISVPVLVLKRVKLPWKKKLYLGCSLCLSVILIVVAVLQAATLTYMGVPAIDVVWEIYFQFVELTLAVILVSATAFQVFFIQRAQQGSDSSPSWTPKCSWCKQEKYKKVWSKVWPSRSTEKSHAPRLDPQIPRAEMTGMRSMIDRAAGSPRSYSGEGSSKQVHELQGIRTPKKARAELAGSTMSMVDPMKEYNNLQRELQTTSSPSKALEPNAPQSDIGAIEAVEDSNTQRVMPLRSLDSGFETAEAQKIPSAFATRDQRSHINYPIERPQPRLVAPNNSPTLKAGVSPLEPYPYLENLSKTSQIFGESPWQRSPSTESKNSPYPSTSQPRHPILAHPTHLPLFEDNHFLPPTPPANPTARIEHFLGNSSYSSPQQFQHRPMMTNPSKPSTARRPRRQSRKQPLLRESGLKSAIKNSFERASDLRSKVEESWFLDEG